MQSTLKDNAVATFVQYEQPDQNNLQAPQFVGQNAPRLLSKRTAWELN
jgi:hypothetical protein